MKLMVLDGNSIINRAFYGIRLLTTSDGLPTNAVYGFLNILQKLTAMEEPDALCVTFDLPAPTFRHKQFDGYKAKRKGMPDELAAQMPVLKEVLDAMNIPRFELSGWEADDLIGTIAAKCETENCECVIVTGDKDSLQLITDKTRVLHVKTSKGQTETKDYTVAAFTDEYGFGPIKMIDLKALMGDASDNIPGVAGVGEKTAMELIQRFGGIEDIYSELDTIDIKPAVRKKLETGRDAAKMSYELAEIHCDAPIDFQAQQCVRKPVDNDALYKLFTRLEFTKLGEKFGLTTPGDGTPIPIEFEGNCESVKILSQETANSMLADITNVEYVVIRHEKTFESVVVLNNETAYVLSRYTTPDFDNLLKTIFSAQVKKAGHDIKDTQRFLFENGYMTAGWIFDSALAAYLVSPTDSAYELPRLAEKYCGFYMPEFKEENDGQLSLLEEHDEAPRLMAEAAVINALMKKLMPKLEELGLLELYNNIELPLCPVLADMETEGFLVDKSALFAFGKALTNQIDELETKIYEYAGGKFNINSPKQLGKVLFDDLMLPAPKKTKTGYSTGAEVLEKLAGKHPIIGLILEYRQFTKLKSTYADGLLKVIESDGRIHTRFQMTVTATGRLSSTEPNLQNIPIRSELGGEIRKMFIAGDGNVLVDADYSQIELRLLAHISGDTTMQEAFKSGEDIHRITASQVFDTPFEAVTQLQRSQAKAVNFGIVYGISPFSLSQDIGVSMYEAKQYIESYLEKYRGVRQYMKNVVEKAGEDGFVTTMYGRRRYLPELKASNRNTRAFGERVALNMPIQGTAADIIKIAMINVYKRMCREGLKARLILQVHDELIVECPEQERDIVARILEEEMENAASLTVPLTAEAHYSKNWHDAK